MLIPPAVLHIARACASLDLPQDKFALHNVLVGTEDSTGYAFASDKKSIVVAQWPLPAEPEKKMEWLIPQAAFNDLAEMFEGAKERGAVELAIDEKGDFFPDFPTQKKIFTLTMTRRGQGVAIMTANAEKGAMPPWRTYLKSPTEFAPGSKMRLDSITFPHVANVVDLVLDPQDDRHNMSVTLFDKYCQFNAERPADKDQPSPLTITAIVAPIR